MLVVTKESKFNDKYPVLEIWEANVDGEPIGQRPIISFGKKKAQAVLAAMDKVMSFVNDKEQE